MDFNADGHSDLVMGTFEGVAFLVPGSKTGFKEPERILDSDGKTILLSQFWNNDTDKWEEAERSPKGQQYPKDHCISVVAVDWDNDGDLDLLLGAKEGGLYLRRNNGSAGKPSFATTNERIESGGQPFMVPGGLTAPRLLDWNKDGLFDLLCGSFGGGVYLYLNTGKMGQPAFGQPQVLVPASEDRRNAAATEPTRPTEGCYVDAADYDGDGKLDLLVGGYSSWTPPQRQLTDAETKEVGELEKQLEDLRGSRTRFFKALQDKAKGSEEEFNKLYAEFVKTEEYKQNARGFQTAQRRLDELRPRAKREAFVWLYRGK